MLEHRTDGKENDMELISREELLKQIETDSKGNEGQYGDEWLFIDTINSLPTVEERKEGEWIPVSERLPKNERKTYLIATECGYMCLCRWTDDIFGLGGEFRDTDTWGWSFADRPQYSKIVAWMPLPKPWKGE